MQQYTATDTKIVNGRIRQTATSQVYRLTRFHYLSNKNLEFQRCRDINCDDLLPELDSAYQRFRDQLGTSSLNVLENLEKSPRYSIITEHHDGLCTFPAAFKR